jgi:glyoxylase-like metal-dependent hydrolase (beta-lactamase superfamily II)
MSKLKVTSMNRRAFVMSSAAGALSSAALPAFNAGAKEAMIGNKAAAWYRFKLGDFEATVISDGTLNLGPAAALFPKTPKETVEGVIASQFQSPAALIVQENCLVLNTGDKLVLFDSGIGTYKVFGTAAGRLETSLAASGIKPDDIDAIILTHGHIDHLSGIMSDEGKRLFPTAQIIMSKVEHDFWTDEAKTSSTGVMKTSRRFRAQELAAQQRPHGFRRRRQRRYQRRERRIDTRPHAGTYILSPVVRGPEFPLYGGRRH